MSESSTSIVKIKALLGDLSTLLHFAEEGDIVLAKPKQFLSKDTFEELQRRVEELGGRYVNHNTGFEIPKVVSTGISEVTGPLEKPVEKVISEEPASQVGFEPTIPKKNVARPRKVSELLTTNIRLAELEIGVFSPRKTFSQRYIDELAEDIEREGQLKPIVVRPHPEKPDVYQLIDGEHRVRALMKLGRSLIRAEVKMLSDEEALYLALRINELHGKRLDPLEEAMHMQKMMESFGYSETEIGKKMRKSQQWVSDRLSLVKKTCPEVQNAVTTQVVKPRHVREVVKLPKEHQPEVLSKIIKEKLSSRKTRKLVAAIKENPDKKKLILSQPITMLAEIYKPIEEFKKAAVTPPEKPVIEFFACPCGRRYVIDWIGQTMKETAQEEKTDGQAS